MTSVFQHEMRLLIGSIHTTAVQLHIQIADIALLPVVTGPNYTLTCCHVLPFTVIGPSYRW